MHWVKITWGECADISETYHFDTEKEMKAFLDGVEEGNGWLAYDIEESSETKVSEDQSTIQSFEE